MTHKKQQDAPEFPSEESVTDVERTVTTPVEGTPTPESTDTEIDYATRATEYLDDLKRVQAEFENYKKRVKNDEKELYGHLVSRIVTELLPVLDNFHAATQHVPADQVASPWVTGITYIEKQFEDVLAGHGVEPLEVQPGDAFDPAHHEALDHKPQTAESIDQEIPKAEALKIEKVVQKGYRIKDKIIRAAKVIVS